MKTFEQAATRFPAAHFWKERIDQYVIAIHCCRSWEQPANGVFMLFFVKELHTWAQLNQACEQVLKKLVQREKQLFGWYHRGWKRELANMDAILS